MLTRLFNLDPPQTLSVKLGFIGVYIIFAKNIDCRFLLKLLHLDCTNKYQRFLASAKIRKMCHKFFLKLSDLQPLNRIIVCCIGVLVFSFQGLQFLALVVIFLIFLKSNFALLFLSVTKCTI